MDVYHFFGGGWAAETLPSFGRFVGTTDNMHEQKHSVSEYVENGQEINKFSNKMAKYGVCLGRSLQTNLNILYP